MPKAADITGERFGRLVAIHLRPRVSGKLMWLMKCDCGNEVESDVGRLRRGNTKSCGCLHADITSERSRTHGKSCSRAHDTWERMKQRCHNPKHKDYGRYGGRGISVCPQWRDSFIDFFNYMGDPPPGMSIDRFPNNNGNYEPGNVRWATPKQQSENSRSPIIIESNGKSMNMSEWARHWGVQVSAISWRISNGMDPSEAVSRPFKGHT